MRTVSPSISSPLNPAGFAACATRKGGSGTDEPAGVLGTARGQGEGLVQVPGQHQVAMAGDGGHGTLRARRAGAAAMAAGGEDRMVAGQHTHPGLAVAQRVERLGETGLADPAQGPVGAPLGPPGGAQTLHMDPAVPVSGLQDTADRPLVAPPGRGETVVEGPAGHVVIAWNAHHRRVEGAEETGRGLELGLAPALGEIARRDDKVGPGRVAERDEGVDQVAVFGAEMQVRDVKQCRHSVQSRNCMGVSERRSVRVSGM